MMIYALLCYEFAQISVFAFGGGLAALPFLYALVDKYGWYTEQTLVDIIAVSESTPGAIGINMATYVGYTVGGVGGGALATVAYVAPSLLIGVTVAVFLVRFKANPYVDAVFYGIRPAACGLIAAAGAQIMSIALLDLPAFRLTGAVGSLFRWPSLVMFTALTVMTFKLKWHPLAYIAIAAAVGIGLGF
ncbi:MAG: chromate transporter [Peptococcaceae bacterium]|jgi:chromate transporter|nr:chromate transporter [Peptococcaceae bacterium]